MKEWQRREPRWPVRQPGAQRDGLATVPQHSTHSASWILAATGIL